MILIFFSVFIYLFFYPLFPAGELEKQQGTKAPSLKNNGAQLELRGRQGSPSGGGSTPPLADARHKGPPPRVPRLS